MTTNNCKWYMDDMRLDIDRQNDKKIFLFPTGGLAH